jgi:hypothetical protein
MGPAEILRGRSGFSSVSDSQSLRPSLTDFTTVISDFNKITKQKIILVLHAELASVRALLVKGLDHSNLPSTLELVCDVPSLLQYSCTHTHKQNSENVIASSLEHTYNGTHCDTHTHSIFTIGSLLHQYVCFITAVPYYKAVRITKLSGGPSEIPKFKYIQNAGRARQGVGGS